MEVQQLMRGVSFAAFVLYPMTINMSWLDYCTVQYVVCPSCEVTVVLHALQAKPAPVEAILYSFVRFSPLARPLPPRSYS